MITCKICGQPYPETREYWYFRRGKREGLKCRECERRLARAGYRIPFCECCGEPILEALNGKRKFHTDNDHPKCQEAHQANKRAAWTRYRQKERKNPRRKVYKTKQCPLCFRRMPAHYKYACDHCRAGVLDDNSIYIVGIPYREKKGHLGGMHG